MVWRQTKFEVDKPYTLGEMVVFQLIDYIDNRLILDEFQALDYECP